jgi:hypothetical protein
MPCWPDLWREALSLWRLYVLILFLAVIALMLWAPRVRWFWVRVLLRLIGGAAALLVLVVFGFVALISSKDPKPEYRTVTSPSGSHQAILKYQSGWLAMDTTRVSLTNKGCCQHFIVFEYDGASDPSAVTMTWIDESHLRITYYSDPREYRRCVSQVRGVSIVCNPVDWPSQAAIAR